MKRLWSNDERRTHGVQRKFLKVITSFPGEDLVDHERLVAPPGRLQLPGGGEPQLGLTVHGVSPVRSFFAGIQLYLSKIGPIGLKAQVAEFMRLEKSLFLSENAAFSLLP
ncbi:hypothetical protein XENOCAPTIV_029042 [Xenoophorus captivus]|uniref:Uncharacterized protein n=1 Tax=Xenoophorus captivus TaxID=1517983 RepID=A0ABV0S3R0_9TELE